jgi:hypothetical protein
MVGFVHEASNELLVTGIVSTQKVEKRVEDLVKTEYNYVTSKSKR